MATPFHGKIILIPQLGANELVSSFHHPAVMKIFALCQLTGVSSNPPRIVSLPVDADSPEEKAQTALLFELLGPSSVRGNPATLSKIFSAFVDHLALTERQFDILYLRPPYKVQFD